MEIVKVGLLLTVIVLLMQDFVSGQPLVSTDRTRQPEAAGTDVVFASVSLIQESEIFPDDKRFLRRLAYVETRDGVDINTFRSGYFGGIWQVDEAVFNETLNTDANRELLDLYPLILELLEVDWALVTWNDLLKPFFSALAARIYLATLTEPIPPVGDLTRQGQYWLDHFSSNPSDSVQLYIDSVNEFELEGEAWICVFSFMIKQLYKCTVEPSNVGHFRSSHSVLCTEVVLCSEAKLHYSKIGAQSHAEICPLLGDCPSVWVFHCYVTLLLYYKL